MSPAPEHADAARSRFDRGLQRAVREQTTLLDWLAEAHETRSLRDEADAGAIDLRDQVPETWGDQTSVNAAT